MKNSSDTDEKLNPNDLSAPPGVKINDPKNVLKRNWTCKSS